MAATKVLIAYQTRSGATAESAALIAEVPVRPKGALDRRRGAMDTLWTVDPNGR